MAYITPFETHADEYEAWFDKYHAVYESEILAIKTQFEKLPENIHGIEVGLGSGKYALPLGIKEGVEPSEKMRGKAIDRGIDAMDASAESLPYKDLHFDFVLFVTICHLNNPEQAFKEANRVLKHHGSLIIGFIDKNGLIGQNYEARRSESTFYKRARFFTPEEVKEALKAAQFKDLVFNQTLFGKLDDIHEIQEPKEGYGEGSFVVVRATKSK